MKRLAVLAGALVVTLGSVGFDVRRYTQHERRLRKVMTEPQPTVERLTQAFNDEGTRLVTAPASREETERVIAGQGGKRAAELRAKAMRYPAMRVFATADMLYFVFFDRDGVMRDFTLVSR